MSLLGIAYCGCLCERAGLGRSVVTRFATTRIVYVCTKQSLRRRLKKAVNGEQDTDEDGYGACMAAWGEADHNGNQRGVVPLLISHFLLPDVHGCVKTKYEKQNGHVCVYKAKRKGGKCLSFFGSIA